MLHLTDLFLFGLTSSVVLAGGDGNEGSGASIDQGVNTGLSVLLAVNLVAFVGAFLLQRPWRICFYPSAAWRHTDAENKF